MLNPLLGLLRSRKFLLLVLDTIISLALYFVGRYATPDLFEDIKFLIAALQPIFVALICAIAYEDGQAKRWLEPRSKWPSMTAKSMTPKSKTAKLGKK